MRSWHFDAGFLSADVVATTLGEAKAKLKEVAVKLEDSPIYSHEDIYTRKGIKVSALLPDVQIDDDRNWIQ